MFGTFPNRKQMIMCCLRYIMDSTVIRNKEIYSKEWQNLYTEKKEFLKNSLLVPNFNMLAYICIIEKHSGISKI